MAEDFIKKIKNNAYAYNAQEYNQFINFFTNVKFEKNRLKLYKEKMTTDGLPNEAAAKHELVKQVFSNYVSQLLHEANIAAKAGQKNEAKQLVDELGKLSLVFKNHDVMNYKEFIVQTEGTISEIEAELLFLEPSLNGAELDKLTHAFIGALGKRKQDLIDKVDFQRKFFNHPLIQCLGAYSDFSDIEKHIKKGTLQLGEYRVLVETIFKLKKELKAEEYQNFITYVIKEDITLGFNNIIKNESYRPLYLRLLLKNMTEGKILDDWLINKLVEEIRTNHNQNVYRDSNGFLKERTTSIGTLNDYGFAFVLNEEDVFFHGHSTENAGQGQRNQQINTASNLRGEGFDTVGLTVLLHKVSRTGHHKNALSPLVDSINMSKTEEIVLSGLQFDAAAFVSLADYSKKMTMTDLHSGNLLSSNHYIIKDDIARSQKVINTNLGKSDFELICEKKNAYFSLLQKNKDFFKKIIQGGSTVTENQIIHQVIGEPLINFMRATMELEEKFNIELLNPKEVELVREVSSFKCFNEELKAKMGDCLKYLDRDRARNASDYKSVSVEKYCELVTLGEVDKESENRDEMIKKMAVKDFINYFNEPKTSLSSCLEKFNDLDDDVVKLIKKNSSYKKDFVEAVSLKIEMEAFRSVDYHQNYKEKEKFNAGIKEVIRLLNKPDGDIFLSFNSNADQDPDDLQRWAHYEGASRRVTLAKMLRPEGKTEGQRRVDLTLFRGIALLADIKGKRFLCDNQPIKAKLAL